MAPDAPLGEGAGRIPEGRPDAFDDWMARFAELDDATVDDLLRGNTPEGYEDLAPVAELAVAVRARATAHDPEISPALRAQLLERPPVPPRYVGVARRRLRLGAAAAAAVAVVGVAAAQNALPASAQRFVSSAADLVGLDVPRPDDDGEGPVTTVDEPESTSDDGEAPGDGGHHRLRGARAARRRTAPLGQSSTGGPPDETPGGATPADPGTPGDHEPADARDTTRSQQRWRQRQATANGQRSGQRRGRWHGAGAGQGRGPSRREGLSAAADGAFSGPSRARPGGPPTRLGMRR